MYFITIDADSNILTFSNEVGDIEIPFHVFLHLSQNVGPFHYDIATGEIALAIPPTSYHEWVNNAWVLNVARLNADRLAVWEDIKNYRTVRKASGTQVGANWFHSDDSSRIQQLGLVLMGANIPAGLMWKTMSGTWVAMTQTLAGQIFGATANADSANHTKAEQHRAGVNASSEPLAYNYKTAWPLVYGE